jgi:Lrp/AsnC family transcriptional regulator
MEAAGVVKGRVALLDAESVGCPLTVFVQVRAAQHSPEWAKAFAESTRSMPEILGVFRMTGDLDYLIKAQVSDMADYDRLYQELISRVDMAEISASFVMENIKDSTALPV